MKISFISPTSLIGDYGNQGDFHLALAHLLEEDASTEYENALLDSGLPIYLDNGLFENGKSIPVDKLMRIATKLNAEYVFAPDVLFDRQATEHNIEEAAKVLAEQNKKAGTNTKLAAVVQANNPKDFVHSYKTMVEDDRISLIGLSILSIPESFKDWAGADDIVGTRLAALSVLSRLEDHKDSHLLGAGSSYLDVAIAENMYDWVVSHDSSSAIWNGVQGKRINDELEVEGGKTEVAVDFDYSEPLTKKQHQIISKNIYQVLKATNHE